MKALGYVFVLCLIAGVAFAGSSAEIVSTDIDSNGNIRVWTQYKVDGVEVDSKYDKIDGKKVFCSRYNKMNFFDKTDAEIKTAITKDVSTHAEALIRKEYVKKSTKVVKDSHLKDVVGTKITKETTEIKIDTDGDNVADKTIVVRTDGTSTVKP